MRLLLIIHKLMLLNGKDDKNWDMWCVYAKRAKMLLYFSIIIDPTEI